MDKLLINVFVPLIDDNFEVKVPINLEMKEAVQLIQEAIVDLSNKAYIVNPNARLFDKNTGNLINVNNIVKFSGLTNGASIMIL